MALKLLYVVAEGDFDKGIQRMNEPIAAAATAAVSEAGTLALTLGRASINGGGFSAKWSNAYRLRLYPSNGQKSIDAAAYLYHKIPYADVFEEGATIHGKPNLWIPLRNVPKKIGRFRMTPANYEKMIGPLFPIVRPGKPTLLAARVSLSARGVKRTALSVSVSTLKSGGKTGRVTSIPLFVAVSQVNLKRRFRIREATDAARNQLPSLYLRNLQAD